MLRIDENYFRYVPIRQRDIDWGLYVTGAGCTAMPTGYTSYPLTPHPTTYDFSWRTGRKLPEYTAVYITSGCGEFESTPTGRVKIDTGTAFLLFPDVWHRYRPSVETGWDEYWVSFAGDTMDRLVERGFFSAEHALLATGVEQAILEPFRSLLDRLRGEVTGFPHLIAADTIEILSAVLATAHPGSESFVVGSHEFYLGYAVSREKLLCLDAGHFHPTEVISDKISSVLQYVPQLLLHVSRGVRWDSDHVVTLTDELRATMQEIVRGEFLDRVHIGLDFFDASINRVAAWVVGTRATLKALLIALLEPIDHLRQLEDAGDYTARLAMLEEIKTIPIGSLWDYYCLAPDVPIGATWMDDIRQYETDILSNR